MLKYINQIPARTQDAGFGANFPVEPISLILSTRALKFFFFSVDVILPESNYNTRPKIIF